MKNNTEKEKISFNEGQKRIIGAKETLLISASAGSGKTTVMVENILSKLCVGGDLDDMLVVTFGSAAAEEISLKLQKKLNARLQELDAGADKKHLQSQLFKLPANISTLHSFCTSLIRSRGFTDESVNPNAAVSDEADSDLRKARALDETLEDYYRQGDTDFLMLSEIFSRKRKDDLLKESILKIDTLLCTMPKPEEFTDKIKNGAFDYKSYLDAEVERHKNHYIQELKKLLKECAVTGTIEIEPVLKQLYEFCPSFSAEPPKFLSITSKRYKDFIQADFKEKVKAFKENFVASAKKLYAVNSLPEGNSNNALTEKLLQLREAFIKNYTELKQRDEVMDFTDLERAALKLLEKEELREEVRNKFKYIYVDEYQDINPMQECLLSCISRGDNLIMVGDVKQSIFGFRLCEPQIFADKYKLLSLENKTALLNVNYRSRASILDFVNCIFSPLMTDGFGRTDYKTIGMLNAFRTDNEGENSVSVDIVVTEKSEPPAVSGDIYSVREHNVPVVERVTAAEAEALIAAEKIRSVVGKPVIENGAERTLTYSDIVILCRSIEGEYYKSIKRTLEKAGIPLRVSFKTDIFKEYEIALLLDILRVVYNCEQDYSLANIMMSPVFEFDSREMSEIRLKFKSEKYFYRAVKKMSETDCVLGGKVKAMFCKLNEYSGKSKYMTVTALIRYIINDCDFIYKVTVFKKGQARETIEIFINRLASLKINTDLSGFISFLNTKTENIVLIGGAESDAVTMTTIHQSKGLEYPVVILCGLGKNFSRETQKQTCFVSRELGVGLPFADKETRALIPTKLIEAMKICEMNREKQEEMRLLYVALTRARDRLFLIGADDLKSAPEQNPFNNENAGSMLEWILLRLRYDDCNDLECAGLKSTPESRYELKIHPLGSFAFQDKPENVFVIQTDEEAVSEIQKRQAFFNNLSKTPSLLPKITVTEAAENLAEDETKPVLWNASDGDRAIEKGNAYHKVFERIDFSLRGEGIAAFIEKLHKDGVLSGGEYSSLDCQKIENCIKHPIFQRAGKLYREQAFMMYTERNKLGLDGGDVKILAQGIIDALIVDNNNAVIIDYKTTAVSGEEELRKLYAPQLRLYKLACESILGLNVTDAFIMHVETAKAIKC